MGSDRGPHNRQRRAGRTADASAKAADSDTILQESFGATKNAVNETGAALGEVIDALNTYYGFALDASNASIALESSFDKASEAVRENGRTLDINTEKGRDNTSALNDVAEAAQKAMLAHAKNGEGLEQITPIVQSARPVHPARPADGHEQGGGRGVGRRVRAEHRQAQGPHRPIEHRKRTDR